MAVIIGRAFCCKASFNSVGAVVDDESAGWHLKDEVIREDMYGERLDLSW